MYDFGEVIDRRGSDSTKWDYRATPNGPQRWDAANLEHAEACVHEEYQDAT